MVEFQTGALLRKWWNFAVSTYLEKQEWEFELKSCRIQVFSNHVFKVFTFYQKNPTQLCIYYVSMQKCTKLNDHEIIHAFSHCARRRTFQILSFAKSTPRLGGKKCIIWFWKIVALKQKDWQRLARNNFRWNSSKKIRFGFDSGFFIESFAVLLLCGKQYKCWQVS